MKTQLPRCTAALLSCLVLAAGLASTALAGTQMDGLLINPGPSPCLAVRVRVTGGGGPMSQLTVGRSGVVKLAGASGPVFVRGKSYRLQGSCVGGGVSSSDGAQSSGLSFTADGRTVMLVFTDSGFLFKRGGVAY